MKTFVAALVMLSSCVAFGQMTPMKLRVLADSAVKIETATGWGSGTAIGLRTVLTCEHVIHGAKAKTITVKTTTHAGISDIIPAEVLRVDEKDDLALLHVAEDLPSYTRVADRDAEDFVKLWKISSPGGEDRTVSEEMLSKTTSEAGTWHLTGSEMKGSSGGGVFDECGELQCVFSRLWVFDESGPESHSGVMGICVDRPTVAAFLKRGSADALRE